MRLSPSASKGVAPHRGLLLTSVLLTASALLVACGGGNSTTPTSASPQPEPSPESTSALSPLSGGSHYLGTLSFGDTLSLQLDTAAQQITLHFVDSHFGLDGAITSPYAIDHNGQSVAQQFQALAGSALPAGLDSQLSSITLRFTEESGLISGLVSGLPNLLGATGATLHGTVTASNQGAAQVSALAGTYHYLRQEALYSPDGQPGSLNATAGQLHIASDGTWRACPGQAISEHCTDSLNGRVSVEPDQSKYPGALAIELQGQRIGRAIVAKRSGSTVLSIDVHSPVSGGFNSGSWLLQAAGNTPVSPSLEGEWMCSQPETGRSMRHYVSIANGLWQTDTIDTDLQISANGLLSARWVSGNQATRTMLPLSASTFFYAGSSTPSAQSPDTATYGLCQRLPEQPWIHTYLGASPSSTDPVMISLADALPTQPAVGYDQIYYKQGRYRHVMTGNTASTQWQKAFDDLCEDSGRDSTAKNGVSATSRLNDRTTFSCKAPVANYQSLLKTAVVGPKGQLFLTDGHHSFTSLWEAPNSNGNPATGLAGGQVQMPVMIKGNYQEANNATFWRAMRASKFVWLQLPDGSSITPADLPRQLGLSNGLQNDPYRSLVYFTREVGYDKPINPSEFLEFYWSEWLQAAPRNFQLSAYNLNTAGNGSDGGYMQAIRDASQLMLAANPAEVIGASGYSATQMGQLQTFGQTAYAELSTPKPADGKKAGKLAYALEYRASLNHPK